MGDGVRGKKPDPPRCPKKGNNKPSDNDQEIH